MLRSIAKRLMAIADPPPVHRRGLATAARMADICAMAKRAFDYKKLSIQERLQLVADIWDSIADETEALPLTTAQKAELDRRLEQHRSDPDSAVPWEQVREELNKPGG